MINELPVSVDAAWMDSIITDITPEQEQAILKKLEKDPYFGTVHLTDIQSGNLVGLHSKLTPLEKSLYQKIDTFFEKYPNIYVLTASIEKMLKFEGGALKPVNAIKGDSYKNLEEAVLSLVPANSKKELQVSISDYKKSLDAVARKKAVLGDLEKDEASKEANKEKIAVIEQEIKDLEKIADEKEKIMDEQWKVAIANIDTSIDDKKIALAKKIYKVLTAINDGTLQASCLYTTALAKTYQSLGQLDDEAKRLALATAVSPALMQKRIARLKDNAIMTIPNILVGSYAIAKQKIFVNKYIDVVEKIVKIDEDRQKLANKK
jgi:hypothetical protein